jgi:hypothetical protein
MDQQNNTLPHNEEVVPIVNTEGSKKIISKKLFWTLYILSNIVPIFIFFFAIFSLFGPDNEGLGLVGMIVAAGFSGLYGVLINIVLLSQKEAQKRKAFIISASIFISIGIIFLGGPLAGSYHVDKVKAEAKEVNGLIIEANTFEECRKISGKINYLENKRIPERCFRRVLYITKDLDSCLSTAKLAEFWIDPHIFQKRCIESYAFITDDDKYCDLLDNIEKSLVQDCKRAITSNSSIKKELYEVFSNIKNIEECSKYTHQDIVNICRDFINKK